MLAVETQGLAKQFAARTGWRRLQRDKGGTQAVRGVDLAVEAGELFGLLGPNGAGKTTLVKMLCTLIEPSGGAARIAGRDLQHEGAAIRAAVGLVVTDERSFYWRISARRNLVFFAALHGLYGAQADARVDEVLEAVDLRDRAETPFSDFSTGMRQRMAIARGLLHRPQILFLDEPSRSLDPTATNRLHRLILDLMAARGMTVFLITHDLVEAEKLCHRVAVMHRGMVRGVGSAAELRGVLRPLRRYVLAVAGVPAGIAAALRPLVEDIELQPGQIAFRADEQGGRLTDALDLLRQYDVVINNMTAQPPSLEEVFTYLTHDEAL